jgi:hypothetical protein
MEQKKNLASFTVANELCLEQEHSPIQPFAVMLCGHNKLLQIDNNYGK